MRGTPTLLLIDRSGRLRQQIFGHVPDLQLSAEIMHLLFERSKESSD
jgi:thioredoxin-related protein